MYTPTVTTRCPHCDKERIWLQTTGDRSASCEGCGGRVRLVGRPREIDVIREFVLDIVVPVGPRKGKATDPDYLSGRIISGRVEAHNELVTGEEVFATFQYEGRRYAAYGRIDDSEAGWVRLTSELQPDIG